MEEIAESIEQSIGSFLWMTDKNSKTRTKKAEAFDLAFWEDCIEIRDQLSGGDLDMCPWLL